MRYSMINMYKNHYTARDLITLDESHLKVWKTKQRSLIPYGQRGFTKPQVCLVGLAKELECDYSFLEELISFNIDLREMTGKVFKEGKSDEIGFLGKVIAADAMNQLFKLLSQHYQSEEQREKLNKTRVKTAILLYELGALLDE